MADQLSKRAKNDDEVFGEDRISQLPTVILICILSFLKLDEAARTSVLSKHWRELWKFTARLDFDGSLLLRNQEITKLSKGKQRVKYLNWVNKVLKSVKSNKEMGLDEFRISFELLMSTGKTIFDWLKYAFERRVQRLELDFSSSTTALKDSYHFPRILDQITKEVSEDPEGGHGFTGFNLVITDFTFLRSLSLSRVSVSGQLLEFILRKFPFLEYLSVCESITLYGISVCGSTLALKHLEIINCPALKSMIVRDTRIISLKVSWEPAELVLENNPKLVDVCFGVTKTSGSEFRPSLLSCLSGSEVQVLTLLFSSYQHRRVGAKLIKEAPRLPTVKQLTLVVEEVWCDDFIHLPSLMGSSFPNLEKFVFKLNNTRSWFMNVDNLGKPPPLPIEHLQVFELHGYCGRASENEAVMHIVKNAAALQSITIKISDFEGLRFPDGSFDSCEEKSVVVQKFRDNAKFQAHHLKGGMPSSIGVDIL